MSIWEQFTTYVSQNGFYIWTEFYRHFLMAAYGVLFASIVSIPIGVLIARYGKLSGWVLTLGSIIQTIPVLGFMAITMVAMGLGTTTVITTVFFLFPIAHHSKYLCWNNRGRPNSEGSCLCFWNDTIPTVVQSRITSSSQRYDGRNPYSTCCRHRCCSNRNVCWRRRSRLHHCTRYKCNGWNSYYFSRCCPYSLDGNCSRFNYG